MPDKINRQWILANRPKGMVAESDFTFREVPAPAARDGQILVRNLFVSLDPAMRAWLRDRESYIAPVKLGDVMRAGAVGQVVDSKKQGFAAGDFVVGTFGWQDYCATTGDGPVPVVKVPAGFPLTLSLGLLGMTGFTAYFGLLDVGAPQPGQTVVVSGAAGAVGSIAGQIAKIKGCRAIGVAGGKEKCDWVTRVAHFDACIDYKSEDVYRRLGELCPQGIDVYFDNVGGTILEAALEHLALHARVVLCGGISSYNAEGAPPGPRNYLNLLVKRARMEGFIVFDYQPRFGAAAAEMAGWLQAGKLHHHEDIQEGLENAPKTLLRLFEGKNLGKQLLKIADPPLGK